jgi:predicted small lipoprotein YifL
MRATIAVTALTSILFLSTCGIKGALYVPTPHSPATPPAASQPADPENPSADAIPNAPPSHD